MLVPSIRAAGLGAFVLLAAQAPLSRAQSYSATYLPTSAPDHTEEGQAGTNRCGSGANQGSMCQNAFINNVDDFCLFSPPEPGSTIGDTERLEVSWCLKNGYGSRLIPDGTIQGAYFVETPDYVQITGIGDLTRLNIAAGDEGGELDPHGADGNGNPIGGLVFSSVFGGQLTQMHEWTNFMSSTEFCFRACKDGPQAPALCQHIYDVMGCHWNMPSNYAPGTFVRCKGDSGEPMGVYGTSTFYQGQPSTPSAHPAPATSACTTYTTIGNGALETATMTTTPEGTVMSSSTAATTTPGSATSIPTPSSIPTTSSGSPSSSPTTSHTTSAPVTVITVVSSGLTFISTSTRSTSRPPSSSSSSVRTSSTGSPNAANTTNMNGMMGFLASMLLVLANIF